MNIGSTRRVTAAGCPAPRCACPLLLVLLGVFAVGHVATAGELLPRTPLLKEDTPTLDWRHRSDLITVKFQDDLPIRAENGAIGDRDTGLLVAVRTVEPLVDAGVWHPVAALPEERLAAMRNTAQETLGRAIADPRVEFFFQLPDGVTVREAIDAFNALDIVELAAPVQIPAPSPHMSIPASMLLAVDGDAAAGVVVPPNFEGFQGYLNEAPIGIGAKAVWQSHGIRGQHVRVGDIEYSFNANHADLPDVTVLTIGTPTDPFDDNHGTAVLGQIASIDNGWGTTGIAHDAQMHFSHSLVNGALNIANAIYRCVDAFDAGDVILLEAQMWGPNSIGFPPDCFGCVPVEWDFSTFTAITIAVGNGITVVEAGANGLQNLDDPVYSQGNGGHHPFAPGTDSGAILVGAGHAPIAFGGSGTARSRMWYSNYGSRFDLQGWGQAIWTTGYGGAYSGMGKNYWYTSGFGGTSGASPIVTGAVALIQSYHIEHFGTPMSTDAVRQLLGDTGTPQTSGDFPATQKIGPLPDLVAAIAALPSPTTCPADLDGDGVVGGADLGILLDSWGVGGKGGQADLNGDGVVDGADLGILLDAWGPCPTSP